MPVLALAYLGMSRWYRLGRGLAAVALWTWILFATWTIKLFPMYSGGGSAPLHLRDAWDWYAHRATARATDLSLTALAPAPVLYAGLAVSTALVAILSIAVIGSLKSPPPGILKPSIDLRKMARNGLPRNRSCLETSGFSVDRSGGASACLNRGGDGSQSSHLPALEDERGRQINFWPKGCHSAQTSA